MTLLHDSIAEKQFDRRMIDRNSNRGLVNWSELEADIKNLPDDVENAEWVSVETIEKSEVKS